MFAVCGRGSDSRAEEVPCAARRLLSLTPCRSKYGWPAGGRCHAPTAPARRACAQAASDSATSASKATQHGPFCTGSDRERRDSNPISGVTRPDEPFRLPSSNRPNGVTMRLLRMIASRPENAIFRLVHRSFPSRSHARPSSRRVGGRAMRQFRGSDERILAHPSVHVCSLSGCRSAPLSRPSRHLCADLV